MSEAFEKWHLRVFGYNNSSKDAGLDEISECNRRFSAFNAGLERAAEIAEDTDSCKWDDPTATFLAAAIRKEAGE